MSSNNDTTVDTTAASTDTSAGTDWLRAAFEAMAWRDCTFEAAMRDAIRGRIVRARAAQLRAQHIQRTTTRTVRLVKRCNPVTGAWCTQRVPGPIDPHQQRLT